MNGRVLTVFAAKGGYGKTTLATNLAVVLNAGGARRVCLVDLDLAHGDVANMLSLQPAGSLADAVTADGSGLLDVAAIGSLVTRISTGLDGVLPPVVPGEAARVPAALVGDLLAILPSLYHFTVVDTPAPFSGHVLTALDHSHYHVLLTAPERLALHNLRLTLDMLDMLSYRRASRSVVLNRCDARVGLTTDEVERTIKTPIAGALPSSWDVSTSINRGVPLTVAHPEHRYSRAVRRFVESHITAARFSKDTPESSRPW
jgi:pilus assembly protein CpaE